MNTSTRTTRQRTTDGTTMQAITQDRYGEAEDVLRLEEIGRPTIGDDEVLLRVHAAGVGQGVWHLMTGLPYPVRLAGYGTRTPKTPVRGREAAGRVEATGPAVTTLHVGDEARTRIGEQTWTLRRHSNPTPPNDAKRLLCSTPARSPRAVNVPASSTIGFAVAPRAEAARPNAISRRAACSPPGKSSTPPTPIGACTSTGCGGVQARPHAVHREACLGAGFGPPACECDARSLVSDSRS